MSDGSNGSVSEIKWLIEERKRRIEDIGEQMVSETDEILLRGLKGVCSMLRSELAELERELDEKEESSDPNEDALKDVDCKIADIDSQLGLETDAVVRNNLEVSKRFLQMERNALLIKMTQKEKRKDSAEEKLKELEKLSESRLRMIDDLRERLDTAEKERSYYKAVAENPDRKVSCDTTRVTVTAGALRDLRNEAKVLAITNGNLKTENRELKNGIEALRNDVRRLTLLCKESDSQILLLQSKVFELRKQLEEKR